MAILENINVEEVLKLKDLIDYDKEKANNKFLVHNGGVILALFAFEKGQGLAKHSSPGEALVTVLEGEGRFTIDEKEYKVKKNESIVLPAEVPHAVDADEKFKMFLVNVLPAKTE